MSKDKSDEGSRDDTSANPSSGDSHPKKRLITRRRLLRAGGALVATGAVAAGGFALYDQHIHFGRDALRTIPDHRVSLPASTPKFVIARGLDPRRNVSAAIEKLGGMGQFVTRSDVVLIKPNIGWNRTPIQAANTHPDIVAELVLACRAARARRVIVSDCPMQASKSFTLSGIEKAALEAGAEVIRPEDSGYHTVRISERLGTWDLKEPFVIATKIINVPVAKHHGLSGVTGGMKNWIGITDKLRFTFHGDIHRSIAELAALMRPTLTVLDASRVLMANGPEGGSLADVKTVNTVAVGVDPVAVDAWASELLGLSGDSLPQFLRIAEEMGLGRADYRAINPVEIVT
jgi:uncharacterized protein (DUF362 family)